MPAWLTATNATTRPATIAASHVRFTSIRVSANASVISMPLTRAFFGICMAVDGGNRHHGPGMLFGIMMLLGQLIMIAGLLSAQFLFTQKFCAFRFDNLILDGQRCSYSGKLGSLIGLAASGIAVGILSDRPPVLLLYVVTGVVVVWRHRQNIQQVLNEQSAK